MLLILAMTLIKSFIIILKSKLKSTRCIQMQIHLAELDRFGWKPWGRPRFSDFEVPEAPGVFAGAPQGWPFDDAWNSKPHLTWWLQLWVGKVHSKGWVFSECWSWRNCNLIPGWLNWFNWKATFYLGWCSSLQGQFDYLTTSTLLILTYTDQHTEIGDESRARIPY